MFGCCWTQWRSAPRPDRDSKSTPPTQKKKNHTERKIKISTSLLLLLLWGVWMLSGLLTGTALTAAVKLMGSSCPPGDWERSWSLHCACQSAGQLQRGKFKNGFWENQVQHSEIQYRDSRPAHTSFHIIQNRWFFSWFLSFSIIVFVGLLFLMRILIVSWFFWLYHHFSVGMLNDKPFKPELMWPNCYVNTWTECLLNASYIILFIYFYEIH